MKSKYFMRIYCSQILNRDCVNTYRGSRFGRLVICRLRSTRPANKVSSILI